MENSPYSIYCQNPRIPYYRDTCNQSDLMPVKILEEQYDSDNVCTRKVVIHCCRVCGGFYKQEYRAINYPSGWLDVDEGRDTQDHYYKIEEPYYLNSTSKRVALTLEEARSYGYTGVDFTWTNNRCNFAPQAFDLTCRVADLICLAYRSPEKTSHIDDRIHKCGRCGQFYLFTLIPPYTPSYFKPSSDYFPLELAKIYGYNESENLNL